MDNQLTNLNKLSINVVHTPNYGVELLDNRSLLDKLKFLSRLGVSVNVLINGKPSRDITELCDKFNVISSDERLVLGKARYKLHSEATTEWYMNIDEDDDFMPIETWLFALADALPKINTATAFMKYKLVMSTSQVILPANTEMLKEGPITREYTPISYGSLYNKSRLGDAFCRPYMNLAEDDLFWAYLCSEYKDTTFIDLPVFIYNRKDSVMSKGTDSEYINEDKPLDKMVDFLNYSLRMNLTKIILT